MCLFLTIKENYQSGRLFQLGKGELKLKHLICLSGLLEIAIIQACPSQLQMGEWGS